MGFALADVALARRVERGWGWASEESARAHGRAQAGVEIAIETVAGGSATYFGAGSPFSQAQGLGLAGPVADSDLDRLEAFYDARGIATSIEVASLADPMLLPTLSRRGYVVAEQSHMLILPLPINLDLDLDPNAHDGAPSTSPDLAVSLVGDSEHADWAATVIRGFFEGPVEPPEGSTEMMATMIAAPGCTGWLARVRGEGSGEGVPAGGAALFVHDGLALFAGDATLPAFRRRGAQTALVRARLAESACLGCDLAVACTQPGSTSQRNYERLGFRVVYARTLMVREPGGA